jgi:magnesium chelatase family protein
MATQSCPCGFRGDRVRVCRCIPGEIDRYRGRISGPLLDRIDLHVEVPALEYRELVEAEAGEGTAAVRQRVAAARIRQRDRLVGTQAFCNAQMGARETRRYSTPDTGGARLLEGAMRALGLSARGYAKVLKVARTIADLAGENGVGAAHVAEAVQYRMLDRREA